MSNMKLSMLLRADDKASPIFKKLTDRILNNNKKINTSAAATAAKHQQLVTKNTAVTKKAADARLRLGVRTEKHIRREIQQTQAAYNRLARSGAASANDLKRAYTSMTSKVSQLNRELGLAHKTQSKMSRMRSGASIAGGVVAGGVAASAVLANPVRKQMGYDRKLALVSNTAFSDRDSAGRIEGKKELADAVKKAVETGGGSKDQALSALDTLLASGSMDAKTAMKLLPTLQKGSVATGASTEDLSKIAISAMQQFGIKENQIAKALDMAVAAGQAGNFELADMARWLPQQMAAAKSAGMSGMDGYQSLLVANQQARVTAGSSDEAGNNVVNFLAKLTSKETNDRFKNLDYIDPKDGKTKGIDYIQSMEKGKREGKDPIQAFMGIIDKVVGADSRYQKLQKQLTTADSKDQKRILTEMTNLVEGTAIGTIVSDRQALMAMLGIRNNVALGTDVKNQLSQSAGAVDTSHKVIADTNDFKTEQAQSALENAQAESMKGFNDVIGDVSQSLTKYAQQYPALTSTLAGAATGIAALTAAAGAAAISVRMLGGKSSLVSGAATAAQTLATTSTAAATQGAQAGIMANASRLLMRGNIASMALMPSVLNAGEDKEVGKDLYQRMSATADGRQALAGGKRKALVARHDALATNIARSQKQSTALGSRIDSAESMMDYGLAESLRDKQEQLNQSINDMLAQSQQLSTEIATTIAQSTDAINALAAQPINVQTTNQIVVDGHVVSEVVTNNMGKQLSRGAVQ